MATSILMRGGTLRYHYYNSIHSAIHGFRSRRVWLVSKTSLHNPPAVQRKNIAKAAWLWLCSAK